MTRKLITPLTFAFLLTMVFAGKPEKKNTGNQQNNTVASGQKETGRKKHSRPVSNLNW